MRAILSQRATTGLHLLYVVLVSCAAPLFLGGLLSDIAYARTYEIQWLNFADWLIAGAMVFTGVALAWSLVEVVLDRGRSRAGLIGLGILVATFLVGLLNSLTHARDAWGTMPAGLILSLVTTALAIAAIWFAVAQARTGAVQ
ncbi:hypothetical protein DJ018_14475 [Phenylobacterium deserti]|uniref:DUF2231 domain-containing protein n=1 Tax=Phenylobacterium deserti TaxID=1914756 RepID=A0A328AC04_9CAUL|nr:hypothetical protein DJ018_14475 [Phenylobacterium deserti]